MAQSAATANGATWGLTCRSTGASTAWHLGREALSVHVAPHGPGAMPLRPGYLYYKGFPTDTSNSQPGSIAQQWTQERMFRFSVQNRLVAAVTEHGCRDANGADGGTTNGH